MVPGLWPFLFACSEELVWCAQTDGSECSMNSAGSRAAAGKLRHGNQAGCLVLALVVAPRGMCLEEERECSARSCRGVLVAAACGEHPGDILTPLVQWGPGCACWGLGPRQLGAEGVLLVGDASDGRLQPSHVCRGTRGEGSVSPGLDKGAHIPEDRCSHLREPHGLQQEGLSVQEAAREGLGNAHHLCPHLAILWAVGQHGAGRRGSAGLCRCPPRGSGLAAVKRSRC